MASARMIEDNGTCRRYDIEEVKIGGNLHSCAAIGRFTPVSGTDAPIVGIGGVPQFRDRMQYIGCEVPGISFLDSEGETVRNAVLSDLPESESESILRQVDAAILDTEKRWI